MADNSIPQNVIETLAEIRDGGRFNMFDQRNVMSLAYELDEDAGEWLDDNYGRYMEALNAMGAYVTAHKAAPEAVAGDEPAFTCPECGMYYVSGQGVCSECVTLKDAEIAYLKQQLEIANAVADGFTRARNGMARAEIETQIDKAMDWEDLSFILAGVLDPDTMMMLKATRRKELYALRAKSETLRSQLAAARGLLEAFARSEVGSHNHLHMATIAAARIEYIDNLAKKEGK